MSVDCMRVRLHLRLIRVFAVLVDTIDELVVEVASTRSWSRCPDCGFRCRRVHDTRTAKIRDLPCLGRRTTLWWRRRRFTCANCGARHLEGHDEFQGRMTRRLARGLVADAGVMAAAELPDRSAPHCRRSGQLGWPRRSANPAPAGGNVSGDRPRTALFAVWRLCP